LVATAEQRMAKAELNDRLVSAREAGLTLRDCASAIGIHVATLCRWQAHDRAFRERMIQADFSACQRRLSFKLGPRPKVRWRRDCPICKARVVVRTTSGMVRFWRCGRWPLCEWASWRPRAPRNCKHCGAPCYWSQSRKSIGCSACGVRIMVL
jgi:hypothetical protein